MNIIGSFVCFVTRKHKRGKRDNTVTVSTPGVFVYRCPRCDQTWTRKSKAAKPALKVA